MQVWNVLHVARWKYRTQKLCKKSPSAHYRTTFLGYIFATKACIDNRKKIVKQQYLLHMSLQYGELRPTSGWDRFVSLGHPCKFQLVSRLGKLLHGTLVVGVSQTAALNRGRHLYSAGRPSRWALAHISSCFTSHSTQNRSFRSLSSQPVSWRIVLKKLDLTFSLFSAFWKQKGARLKLSFTAAWKKCWYTVSARTPQKALCLSIVLLWPPYVIGQAIIFLPCGFFYLSSIFFSSPNLSRRRLDVYHTSTHGVALVRI